ncbi:MAG: imidazoleglycerol-phosphate dehydratase HisB [Rhodobacteraceae bacterium]|nr:imidazoleglycerol-phosphate dehydratase HisB [Paracoccaceae bacterium]
MRSATITRETNETTITIGLTLDGTGKCLVDSGVGFLDHMLHQLAHHALFDLEVTVEGDTHIDDHHSTEDVGVVLGKALVKALGDKSGIRRYGNFSLVMDDAWIDVALDLSGRPYLGWGIEMPSEKIGRFDTELVREFFQALAWNGGITLHLRQHSGFNSHHIAEAAFKATARALRIAVESDSRIGNSIPSTKRLL